MALIEPSPPMQHQATRRPGSRGGDSPGQSEGTSPEERAAARVLLVEDEWFVATAMEAALRNAGFEVLGVVATADAAVAAAASGRPDLIIMDIRLRGDRDGVDAAVEIRQRFDIGCLFVTAYDDASTRARAGAARPVGWLTKPVSDDGLVTAVKRCLAGN